MKRKTLFILASCFILAGCNNTSTDNTIDSKLLENLNLAEKLEFELGSNLSISDIVSGKEGVTIVSTTDTIDTTAIGPKEIIIKYTLPDGKEEYATIKIDIKDTEAPVIEAKDLSIVVGNNVDLLKNVKVTDNSNETITPTVEGTYDVNKVGTYTIKYVAVDSSNNKAEKEVTLTVKNISIKHTGYYVYKTADTWDEWAFNSDGTVTYAPWFCPGSGCGGYAAFGTYKLNGNVITATLTHDIDEMSEESVFPDPYVLEFTIQDEKTMIMKGHTYKWQATFEG